MSKPNEKSEKNTPREVLFYSLIWLNCKFQGHHKNELNKVSPRDEGNQNKERQLLEKK